MTSCNYTCDGSSTVSATGGTQPYSYIWNDPASQSSTTASGLCTGISAVTITDNNGCNISDSTVISYITFVSANAGPDTTICQKDTVILSGSGGQNYQWTNPPDSTILSSQSTAIMLASNVGVNQYVLVVNDGVCSDTDSVYVTVISVLVDAGEDQTIQLGNCTDLNGSIAAIYDWSPASTLSDPYISNPEACPTETTTYTLVATNDSGCVDTDSVTIIVLNGVPDGFTPNGDNFNDVWELEFLYLFPNASVQVFNRWGEQLFYSAEGDQYNNKFDGTYAGKPLPVGTYYYIIELNDGETPAINGPLTIMR
jgi:gliding motility-associated-like protein